MTGINSFQRQRNSRKSILCNPDILLFFYLVSLFLCFHFFNRKMEICSWLVILSMLWGIDNRSIGIKIKLLSLSKLFSSSSSLLSFLATWNTPAIRKLIILSRHRGWIRTSSPFGFTAHYCKLITVQEPSANSWSFAIYGKRDKKGHFEFNSYAELWKRGLQLYKVGANTQRMKKV